MKLPWGLVWSDLRLIRQPLLLLASASLACCVAGGGIWLGGWLVQRNVHQQQLRIASQQAELEQAQRDRDAVADYTQRYQTWMRQGVIGADEPRLNWVEVLSQWNQQFPQQGARYTLGPSKPTSETPDEQGLREYISNMTLSAALLHEDDWLRLHAWINARALGLPLPRRCSVERLPHNPSGAQTEADGPRLENRLNLLCQYRFYTIRQEQSG